MSDKAKKVKEQECPHCWLPDGHEGDCQTVKPKKPGLFSKLGSAVGEAVGSWFAGRQ